MKKLLLFALLIEAPLQAKMLDVSIREEVLFASYSTTEAANNGITTLATLQANHTFSDGLRLSLKYCKTTSAPVFQYDAPKEDFVFNGVRYYRTRVQHEEFTADYGSLSLGMGYSCQLSAKDAVGFDLSVGQGSFAVSFLNDANGINRYAGSNTVSDITAFANHAFGGLVLGASAVAIHALHHYVVCT